MSLLFPILSSILHAILENMNKITQVSLILLFLVIFSFLLYIYKSEDDKAILREEIKQQQNQLDQAKKDQQTEDSSQNNSQKGEVQGASAIQTGIISGNLYPSTQKLSDTFIICAEDIIAKQPICTDELGQTDTKNQFSYKLELPQGKYLIYANSIDESSKTFYYSQKQDCQKTACDKQDYATIIDLRPIEENVNINVYMSEN